MIDANKYKLLRDMGKSPHEAYRILKADGANEIEAIRLLREIFGLSLADAKKATGSLEALNAPQQVEIGSTVYWEGSDTIDGFWIMQATVDNIQDNYVYVRDHKKFLVKHDGLVEVPTHGSLDRIPLAYFQKSLNERLQESLDFWRQLCAT